MKSAFPAKVKVDAISTAPSISTTSKFAVPSTSKSPFASILPVKVDTPVTPILVTVATPILTLSRCPVPSMNKSLNLFDDEPKSLASSVEGTMSLSNLPVAVIVSPVASPKSTLPFKVVPPVTVRSPPTFKSSPTVVIPAIETPPCSP